MALLTNLIVFDPEDEEEGFFAFDDIVAAFQPKMQQLEVIVRGGVDGEALRETGVRAKPSQMRTLHAFADRGDAKAALEEYRALMDGLPYEIIQHDESFGFFRVLDIVAQPLTPIAVGCGYLVANPTVLQVLDWVVISTDAPEGP